MTDIKLPPFPEGMCLREDIEDYAREAVRLNAQAVPEPAYVELPDDIRVPLDSVSADAGYLIGRLLLGTMSAAQVIRVIQDRIEVAKAATRTALSAAPAAPQPLDLSVMELAESVGLIGPASRTHDLHEAIQRFHDLIVVNASIKSARHFADGLAKPAQPLTGEKDALLRQSLEALEGFVRITNDSQGVAGYHLNGDTAEWDEFDEVDAASNTIEAIRQNLGVKND